MTTTPQAALLSAQEIEEMALQEQFLLVCDGLDALTCIVRAVESAILAKLQAATPAEPAQSKCLTCNGHGLIGGHMQDGSGYGEGCPDCNPEPSHAATARAALSARKPLTSEQRAEVFRAAESRMVHTINLSWRDAVVAEVERAHGIGLEVKP